MGGRYRLGIVELAFGGMDAIDHVRSARQAAALGFDHLDLVDGEEGGALALPVVDHFVVDVPRPGWSTGAAPEGPGQWERCVEAFRRAPGARVEPWGGSIINRIDKVKAFLAEVPDVTLLLDVGHVAAWGEDPAELIPYAGHIQVRQAHRGVVQSADGDIDFAAFVAELDRQGYAGALSIEYFDLPDLGLPLDDPVGHAVALAEQLRPLLAAGRGG